VEARVSGDLLVITSCTAAKLYSPDGRLRTAESLYLGQQHLRLMRGVKTYRENEHPAGPLRLRILSAFYGLLSPTKRVATYDHTFSGLPAEAIRREAHEKDVPSSIRRELKRPLAAAVLLLGDQYLRACDLDDHVTLGGPVISFCSPAVARRLPQIDGLRTITLTNAEARRFSVGLIALKGELARRILSRLAVEPDELINLVSGDSDVLDWLESLPTISPETHEQEAA
jgi:hypothetical protein